MRKLILACSALALFLTLAPNLAADEKPKATIDESAIYYGNSSDFSKPGVVDVDRVYLRIPEYREIRDRDMDSSDPRYLMLMKAASDKFLAAVQTVADDEGYDLIGGVGSIQIEGKKVPDITSLVIKALPK